MSQQMNVRLDADLKEAGNAALAQAGYTPSAAVRVLWEFAASHTEEPQVIAEALSGKADEATARRYARAQRRAALVDAGPHVVADFREHFGVSSDAVRGGSAASYDDLLFEALTEREQERRGV